MCNRISASRGTFALIVWSVVASAGSATLSIAATRYFCALHVEEKTQRADDLTRASQMLIDAQNLASNERVSDLERAVQRLEAALKLVEKHASSNDATKLRLDLLLALGTTLNDLNRARSALPHLEVANQLADQSHDDATRALLLIELSRGQLAQGELPKAEAAIKSAFEMAKSSGNQHTLARTVQGLADYHYELNDYSKAQQYASEAFALFTQTQDRRGYAKALITLGLIASDLYQSEKATTLYTQALATSKVVDYKAGVVDALTFSGHLAAKEGRLQSAIEFYLDAEKLAQQLGDLLRQSWITSGLAYVYDQSGDAARALEYYQNTLKLRLAVQNVPAEASIYRRLGAAYFSAKEYQQAAAVLARAATLYKGLKQWRYLAATLRDLGGTYEALGQYDRAWDHYTQCRELIAKASDPRGTAYLFAAEGRMLERQNKFEEASERFKEALRAHREVKDRRGESAALFQLGRLAVRQGDDETALSQFEQTIRVDEDFRSEIQGSELSASYLADVRRHYETYIDVLMQLHKKSRDRGFAKQALELSERARARALLDALDDGRTGRNDSREAPELISTIENLKQSLSDKAMRRAELLRARSSPAAVAKIDAEINQLSDAYERAASVVRTRRAKSADRPAPRVLSAIEIQQQVSDDQTVLLEYALGDSRSYLWVVTRESIETFELPDRKTIETQVRQLYALLSTPENPARIVTGNHVTKQGKRVNELQEQSATLARVLLGPVRKKLANKIVVVVADGALHLVPFAALELNSTALIDTNEIVYLPSASVMSFVRKRSASQQSGSKTLAVIADPVFSAEDTRLLNNQVSKTGAGRNRQNAGIDVQLTQTLRDSGLLTASGDLRRLLASRWEANAITSLASGPVLKATDFKANLATALSPELKDYRIIHFATHGVLNTERPSLSGIVLSLFDDQGKPQPGYLRSIDVLEMNLQAELVTLSSCLSAIGKEFNGEGMVGLSRAFMQAGSKRVVASLWKVDDVATSELMTEFYRGMLSKGLKPGAALREAQLKLRGQKRWRSSYYWAAFVLQGEWQ